MNKTAIEILLTKNRSRCTRVFASLPEKCARDGELSIRTVQARRPALDTLTMPFLAVSIQFRSPRLMEFETRTRGHSEEIILICLFAQKRHRWPRDAIALRHLLWRQLKPPIQPCPAGYHAHAYAGVDKCKHGSHKAPGAMPDDSYSSPRISLRLSEQAIDCPTQIPEIAVQRGFRCSLSVPVFKSAPVRVENYVSPETKLFSVVLVVVPRETAGSLLPVL